METKKQLSNFLSKPAESDFALINTFRLYTGGALLLAVVFLFLSCSLLPLAAETTEAKTYKLQQRIIENPRDVEAYLQLAMEYSLANNFVKAVETYFILLRIDPNNFHAYNNLGILYRKSGQFRDSIHCYQQAARINPDSYWVPYNMGLCYEAMGRMQEARESYGRALSLNPSFTQALQRLRSLTDSGSNEIVPVLPGLAESQVYLVDSETGQPRIYSPDAPARTDARPAAAKPVPAVTPAAEPEKISEKVVERIKKEKEARKQYRTTRKGSAAAIFNQAMDALDSDNLEKAIEYYVSCIITERDLLSEPENGLIRKGLEHLKERPNRMKDGQFYRGLLIFISGNLELAVPDMQSYLESSRSRGKDINQLYVDEATRIIERYEAEKAEAAAKEQERAAMLAAVQNASSTELPEPEQPRASDFVLKRMSVDQIIDEADRLSRESRVQDAVAVLETGLQSEPDDLRLLMKSANAYTDLLLLKGDQEAGKMALSRFEKVYQKAPENSREWAVAGEMIQELKGRIR
ncbi:MAG: SLEI family protein [uncultured bacterium]|nr:MAG: SLEI family protein [uncultured bacterium]